ncbi:MAG TPA: TonB-dependent receptor [Bacteroidales bacterium]|nr:TonB-dependent receptor [Bacteroidales bacterium]
MKTKITLLIFLLLVTGVLYAQKGGIKGRVFDAVNNQPLPFVNLIIQGTTTGTSSDIEGNYEINKLQPGTYTLVATFVGYKIKTVYEIEVNSLKPTIVDIIMEQTVENLSAVEVKASPFVKKEESPISMRTISANELSRYPGGNRDISKVIQSFPGVAATVAYRNDIIIRGGAPNENRFYIDGIEVPNINHFATQGSSGGPAGMINTDFIREVEFYSSAFPANRGNVMSSIMEFSLKDGNKDKIGGKFTIGASDVGLFLEGPLHKNATFIVSARQSYLKLLFGLLKLPFLPTYNDFQLKYKWKPDNKNELTVLGLGAIDRFKLNTKLQETGTDQQKYLLRYLPVSNQWNYMIGAKYVHYFKESYLTTVLSRNFLNNRSNKYQNNVEAPENLIQDYQSQEIENKFRVEHTARLTKAIKLNYGLNVEYDKYNNSTFNKIATPFGVDTLDFQSEFDMWRYGLFGQASFLLFRDRFGLSLGLRIDGNNYDESMKNPLRQFSPRVSFAVHLTDELTLVTNAGWYYQLPPYTVLGYRNNNNEPVNKQNNISYSNVYHLVAGLEYITKFNLKLNVEGFYKVYSKYPFLVRDSISLANLGGDFGIIGNDEVVSTSKGRSMGIEVLAQQKLYKGFYGIVTYTYVRSEFKDKNNKYVSSSWDNEHIFNITLGKSFKHYWDVGIKWRYSNGSPYTPFDFEATRTIANWNVSYRGIPDYNLLNTLRAKPFHSLDIRVDKKFFWKFLTLNLYVDIQNIYNFKSDQAPIIDVIRDENGNPLVDPLDPSKYQAKYLDNPSGSILPTLGLIIEF